MAKLLPFRPLPDPESPGDRVRRVLVANLDSLYSTAFRLSGRRDLAEDLVHETARKALQAAAGLRHEQNLRAWLFRILVNSLRDHFRRRSSLDEVEPDDDLFDAAPDTETLARAASHDVRRALQQLRPVRRALVLLVDVEGFTLAEAAGMLHLPAGTTASRLARAHTELRALLEEYRENP